MCSLTPHWSLPTTKGNRPRLLELFCVSPSLLLDLADTWRFCSALFWGTERLGGERRSGCLSVPRLSTSNPIRSVGRLGVKLQTSSESLGEDELDDPEPSGSCCWCYGPAAAHVGEFASTQYCSEVSRRVGRLRGGTTRLHAELNQNNLVSVQTDFMHH